MRILFSICTLLWCAATYAQSTFPYNGVKPKEVTSTVFTHANIMVNPELLMEDAMMLVEGGKVVSVGKTLVIPANAVVIDLQGKYIYPSFIDLHSSYGMPKPSGDGPMRGRGPQIESNRKGAFGWNEAIKSDQQAALLFDINEDEAKEYRGIGFGLVLTHAQDGIVRGNSALVQLGDNVNEDILRANVGAHYSFNKGTSRQDYPSSLMGSIALLRQTYYDAQWYANGGSQEGINIALQEMNDLQKLPSFFDAGDKWNVLRADKIGDEFGVQYIIKGSGTEYQRVDDIAATKATFIIPLQYPSAYDVSDPYLARWVDFAELKHWEMAPYNASILNSKGVSFAFTSSGLTDKSEFLKNWRKAVEKGLSKQAALAALTTVPAKITSTERSFGKLEIGYTANFFITSGDIFSNDSEILDHYISGKRFEVKAPAEPKLESGKYTLTAGTDVFDIEYGGEKNKGYKYIIGDVAGSNVVIDTLSFQASLSKELDFVTLTLKPDSAAKDLGVLRFGGWKSLNGWSGTLEYKDGRKADAMLVYNVLKDGAKKKDEKPVTPAATKEEIGNVVYPFTAFGWEKKPEAKRVHIKNATIWTNEQEGKLENADIIISNGKIEAVGKNLSAPGAEVVDGTGLHVTPGIIDEHSHIALASVNEGSQASSAEVEEASVLWPEDIDIYRQLSGGVTAAQLLHGSANPIGGQSALIKMRWGVNADQMQIEGTDGFIKFALGENVKQSNWGDFNRVRFPQTRMGVEQVYYDHFIRAREYADQWKKFNTASVTKGKKKSPVSAVAPRRDLELETLAEILDKQRFITCHSYVQSEINMLMHVADSLGFKVNTFTHILEGYKVADKMKEHGAGGSTFSDWWAYKMEVKDAIPYNAALMWKEGVTVSINSDDAEMARRLNQEAGKTVKYGGVPEEEALKFVTLNPAKLLHLDDRMGSLKVGKDADIVLWTDHPLSIYAKVQKTFVDGICYFDATEDEKMRIKVQEERARIIQKMLQVKDSGGPTNMPSFKPRRHFHCDTMDQSSMGLFYRQ